MHPEIEKLIELALANGDISEKNRAVISRKAESFGEDKDEVDLIIDGKLAQLRKAETQTPANKQLAPQSQNRKEGDVRKCPACGASVPSFSTKCTDCRHEFRNTESIGSIIKFHAALLEAQEAAKNRSSWGLMALIDKEEALNKAAMNAQASVIASFPVPSNKEDMLEFLSLASAQTSSISIGFMTKLAGTGGTYGYRISFRNAWISKCQQIINKGRLFKDDPKFLKIIEDYAKDLKLK